MLKTNSSPTKKPTRRNCIMIVEDDQAIRELMHEILTSEDHYVLTAENGDVALKLLHEIPELPAVILLDLMMPVMDGVTFRKTQLKDPSLSDIPVIVMSADRRITQDQNDLKASQYIKKPLGISELFNAIESLTGSPNS